MFTVGTRVANALRAVRWHRMVWIAIVAWVIFNQGACDYFNATPCDPLRVWTCEP